MTCPVTKIPKRLLVAALILSCAMSAQAMTLTEALQRAAKHDPTVPGSLAQYDFDREFSTQERGSLLPSIGATAKYDQARSESQFAFGSAPAESYNAWTASIEARQPLFRLDWFARGDRATALDEQADTALRQRTLMLLNRVAEHYFSVLLAQDGLAQAEAEARAVRESLQDTRKRYEVGLVPGTDLKEAQARDDLSQARLLAARRNLETTRDALDEITGNGRAALPRLPAKVNFPPLAPAKVEDWVLAAREQSPRIALAKHAVVIAQTDTRSRRSEAMPSVDLVARVAHNDSTDYSLGQLQDDSRIGLELNVPIYAGGINNSQLRQAEASQRGAEAELSRALLETERETRQFFRKVESAYDEASAFDKSVASALAAEAATRAGYDAGTRTITDVLDAKSRVVQAQRDLNNTRYNLLLSLLRLKQSVGTLSDKDFAEIDRLLSASASGSSSTRMDSGLGRDVKQDSHKSATPGK